GLWGTYSPVHTIPLYEINLLQRCRDYFWDDPNFPKDEF
ncbi:unnamed protein product, partial [Oppiella nova]